MDKSDDDYATKQDRAFIKLSDEDKRAYDTGVKKGESSARTFLRNESDRIRTVDRLRKEGYQVDIDDRETNLSKVKNAIGKITGTNYGHEYKRTYKVRKG